MSAKPNLKVVQPDVMALENDIDLIVPIPDVQGVNDPLGEVAQRREIPANSIHVDHTYQRDLSGESYRRIRHMVQNWDWRLFEPPLIWIDGKGRNVAIDGQHTAKAWVSHPDLPLMIPVNVLTSVNSAKIAAEIFMGRNMNRIRLHHLQEYKAALIAEMDWAITVQDVAQATNVFIPFAPSLAQRPNTCMAISAILESVDKYGMAGAKKILGILAEGMLRPIREQHIKAMAILLYAPEYKNKLATDRLKALIRATNDNVILGRSIQHAVETKLTRHETLAVLYFKEYVSRFGPVT